MRLLIDYEKNINMKEHLEYSTAEDVDDLIAALYDLANRMDRLREDVFSEKNDESLKQVSCRSLDRLNTKRDNLLLALNEALSYLRE